MTEKARLKTWIHKGVLKFVAKHEGGYIVASQIGGKGPMKKHGGRGIRLKVFSTAEAAQAALDRYAVANRYEPYGVHAEPPEYVALQYLVYERGTDRLVVMGTAKECADAIGSTCPDAIENATRGARRYARYEVFKLDEEGYE